MTLLLSIGGAAFLTMSIGLAVGFLAGTRTTPDDVAELQDQVDNLTAAYDQAHRDAKRFYRCNQALRADLARYLEHHWTQK